MVHNRYLLIWTEAGIGALVAFVLFLVTTVRNGWRARHHPDPLVSGAAIGLAAAVAGMAVHMNFDIFLARPPNQALWIAGGVLAAPVMKVASEEDPAMTDLSVVVITKNQVWNVDRLVGSVLLESRPCPPPRSCSWTRARRDGTPERAAQHPIGVVRLLLDQPLTAALGRYVGGRETTGELVLFLDGDMELCPGWLDRALQTMGERPDVAAVAGTVVDVPVDTPGTTGHWPEEVVDAWRRAPVPREITNTGGAALHRRSVLEAHRLLPPVPALRGGARAVPAHPRRRTHGCCTSTRPSALHYSTPARTVATLLARRRRPPLRGHGPSEVRHHVGTPLGRTYLRERGYGVVPGLGLVAGAGALATGIGARRWWPFALWATALSSTVGIHAARRRSVGDAMFSLVQRACIVEGTIRGFLTEPAPPGAHPARFEVVQRIPIERRARDESAVSTTTRRRAP